jgi:hypothetical protein
MTECGWVSLSSETWRNQRSTAKSLYPVTWHTERQVRRYRVSPNPQVVVGCYRKQFSTKVPRRQRRV